MKKTLPPREVELCDCCHREGYLETCKFCGSRYCLLCRAVISGCAHQVDVCRNCETNPKLLTIVEKYVPLIISVLEARDIEIGEAFQQGLHPTSETLPDLPALSTPEHSATSQSES